MQSDGGWSMVAATMEPDPQATALGSAGAWGLSQPSSLLALLPCSVRSSQASSALTLPETWLLLDSVLPSVEWV